MRYSQRDIADEPRQLRSFPLTDAPASPRANPWTALWFRPRAAIEAALAADLRGTTLLIALASGLFAILAGAPDLASSIARRIGVTGPALWAGGGLALVAVVAAAYYVGGWLLNALSHGLSGKGSAWTTRAAMAWSAVPLLVANILSLALREVGLLGLAPVSLALGAIAALWSLALFVVMLAQVQAFSKIRAGVGLLLCSLAPLLVIVLVGRALVFQPFSIPSGSMTPTLLVGDYVVANKIAYAQGFPLAQAPGRGDVVVFRHEGSDYVKRIVGLPGEKIQLRAGRLYINGEIVDRRKIEPDFTFDFSGKTITAPAYDEVLPGGVTHRIVQIEGDEGPASNTQVFEIPANAYFVLGDNRDKSMDSRMGAFGFARSSDLIGRADLIYWSFSEDMALRADRIGAWIK